MAGTQIQRRRGTTAEHSTFTGALGELTVDTDKKTVVVHDGITAGGSPLAVAAAVASAYAPLASPDLTGTPTAPTATAGTNTKQIATTEFVQSEKPSAATQAEMEAGTETAIRSMSPLHVAQAIAAKATGGAIGRGGRVFTASGTFTVPAGVTAIKVRGCGGGGSGSTNGGTTSFGTYCSATGGATNGGTATGGDINLTGGKGAITGNTAGSIASGGACGGASGSSASGILGGAVGTSKDSSATGYGNGGGATYSSVTRRSGSGGGYFEAHLTGLTPGRVIPVTIGAGGAGPDPSYSAGSPGIVIVEW